VSFFSGESGEDADMSPDCAPIWFAYGDALLRQEEENPTDDLLGTAASEAKKAAASLASELSGPVSELLKCLLQLHCAYWVLVRV
jgi:hypothetical protein